MPAVGCQVGLLKSLMEHRWLFTALPFAPSPPQEPGKTRSRGPGAQAARGDRPAQERGPHCAETVKCLWKLYTDVYSTQWEPVVITRGNICYVQGAVVSTYSFNLYNNPARRVLFCQHRI